MGSHEDDIFFYPQRFHDDVVVTLSSSSSSSDVEVASTAQRASRKVKKHRGRSPQKRRPVEDPPKVKEASPEKVDAAEFERWRSIESLLAKLEESRRRLELLDQEEVAPCDSVTKTVQSTCTSFQNVNSISVQLQSTKAKESFCIQRNTSMKNLLLSCCKRWGLSELKTKLSFEGSVINLESTAESLGLEDDDLIDVICSG
jgi:hypothetical protein